MRDHAFYLDQLTPREALAMLAGAVERGMTLFEDVRVEASQSAFGATATLVLPETGNEKGIKSQRGRQESLNLLVDIYTQGKGAQPRRMPAREEGLSINRGLAWLLLNSAADDHEVPDPEVETDYLLVGHDLSADEAAEIYEDLRFHATHTRIAAAGGDKPVFLYHVLDDQRRASSFQSALAGGTFAQLNLLNGYGVEENRLFLPLDHVPDRSALIHFHRILLGSAHLLGLEELREQGPLVAISPRGSADNIEDTTAGLFEILYLGSLNFQGQSSFAPDPAEKVDFELHILEESAQQLQNLRAALGQVAPDVGYRLELRPTRYREHGEQERRRLLERQADVTYKLAYLDSVARPRPVLLRFTQKQLPILAQVIRSFPMDVLRKGYPKYGFQSRKGSDAAGLHYLYLEPEDTVQTELDPLLRFGNAPGGSMRFWLDPFWARYYHGDHNECLLFVPEHTSLFPTMHGWETERMDAYMREILTEWFPTQEDMPGIPEKPIYIFENTADSPDHIGISVLDKDNFQPLYTRLGWINDHITISDALGLDRFITEMAQDVTRTDLALEVKRRAKTIDEELEGLLIHAADRLADRLSELTDVVTEEFNQVFSKTHDTTTHLKELYEYLAELGSMHQQGEEISSEAYRTMIRTQSAHRDLLRFIEKLESDIDKEVDLAERARTKAMNKVRKTVAELGTTHQELRRQLLDMLRVK